MLVHLMDGSVQTIARAATLRQKLQINLSHPSISILTPSEPVLFRQAHGRIVTGVPLFITGMTRHGKRSTAKAGLELPLSRLNH